jgi:formylglycine-generating enzyme required for sulfatase activity
MPDRYELEVNLDLLDENRYKLRFRFFRPGDAAESSLGLSAAPSITLNEETLREASGDAEEYGRRLGGMLFADSGVRMAFSNARSAAGSVPLRLRLALDSGAPGLHNLRWETLYDLDRRLGLCADEHVLFSRFLPSATWQSFEAPNVSRLRGLAFIASPTARNIQPIDVPGYETRARAGLEGMDTVVLASGGQATLENLIDRLHAGCDVLLLVAHGAQTPQRSLVFFENPDGSVDAVDVDTLINRLRGVANPPLLAVLISCESAGDPGMASPLAALGPRLVADVGIPAVLAMHGKVTFLTMEKFLPVFFRELALDGQIDRAVAVARARVLDQPDWWMPVLFSRLRDNQLLEPPALARPLELQRFEPETIYIPGGEFLMGRDGGDEVPAAERPCHLVNLPGYRIGKAPVTNAQYAEFVRKTGALVNPAARWSGQIPPPDRLDEPMVGVTWQDALQYCAWLSRTTGRTYSLPTEAQWEKAARGAQGALTAESPYGCVGMVGGIREWTISLWGASRPQLDYPYPWQEDGRNDPSADLTVLRVYRGGPLSAPGAVNSTTRGGFLPEIPGPAGMRHGFRVVLLQE